MRRFQTLNQYLTNWAGGMSGRQAVAATILALAECGVSLAGTIARLDLDPDQSIPSRTASEADGSLDRYSRKLFEDALAAAPVLAVTMDDSFDLTFLDPDAAQIVAIDPLDSLPNVGANVCAGSLFSIMTATEETLFQQPLGDLQEAAGVLQYGPRTMLLLSCGAGTEIFTLDPETRSFLQLSDRHRIPEGVRDFALNTSNYRHWDSAIRYFIDDCLIGEDGPLGVDFDIRWMASLVADACRMITRGGIFLYPGDSRPGFAQGRFRLLHQAAALAMLVQQAGGIASDGSNDILRLKLSRLSQRVPLIFGSANMVSTAVRYVSGAGAGNTHFPLFEHRSLLRS